MSLSSIVEHYGYAAVLVGALAEGETFLLVAGFAAHRGLLRLPEVMLAAFVASTLGDQFFFWLGRRHGAGLFAKYPAVAGQARRLEGPLARHPNVAILSVRFLYGLRLAGPVALGALGVPARKFVPLNMLGAALWAGLFAAIGYQFGNALQWLLDDLRVVEELVLAGLLLAGVAWTIYRYRKGR